MCHLSRLTPEQQRTFNAMPEPYRRALGQQVEDLPIYTATQAREVFDRWVARMEGVDNARRVRAETNDFVAEEMRAAGVSEGTIALATRSYR